MNRNRLLTLAILAAAGIVAFTIIRTRAPDVASREPVEPMPVIQTPVVAGGERCWGSIQKYTASA
jgi:hypothetical protein